MRTSRVWVGEASLADLAAILPGNVDGQFFVDRTCIDCDLCRQIAPASFVAEDGRSVVRHQPSTDAERRQAEMALVTCPTGSIGTREKIDLRAAVGAYPERIEDEVYFCGFSSRDSFGGASYFIVRESGNVLVDSPRFARSLVRRLEEMGGVRTLFLTHSDDVADHEKFHAHFDCERVIHRHDSRGIPAERLFEGTDVVRIGPDLTIVPTPGHTRGHAVLSYNDRFLFTGDHLAWSQRYGQLVAFRHHNWYSWPETIRSMKRLEDFRFEWVLPGHGRRAHFPQATMAAKLAECIDWMERVA